MIDENYGPQHKKHFSYNYPVLWTMKKHRKTVYENICYRFFNSLLAQTIRGRRMNIYWKSFLHHFLFRKICGGEALCNIISSFTKKFMPSIKTYQNQ